MHIVIDIPEEEYTMYKEWVADECANIEQTIIAEGIPLPKGHGDLIDRDELSPKIHGVKSIVAVLDAPTIIEADKEAKNEDSN